MTPAERQALSFLIDEGKGKSSCRQVADQFAAMTGRPIHPASVWNFRVGKLGLPRVGRGVGPKPRRVESH
jgi:hypothetical protein